MHNKLNPVDISFLDNVDGNAFAILAAYRKAARRAGHDFHDIKKVLDTAMSGDYDHLLRTIMATGN